MRKTHKRLILLTLLSLLLLFSTSKADLMEAPKSIKRTATEKKVSKNKVNEIEKKQEGETPEEIIKHKWERVGRETVGGKVENTTIIQVVKFRGLIEEVIWCRSDNQSTFALSYEGEIYVSRDHGMNWHNLQPMILKSTHRNWGISWKMASMMQSPGDHDNIIVTSDANNVWVTKDCGETWKLVADDKNLFGFRFHPHIPGKVLAMHRHTCHRDTSPDCKEHNVLFLSEDHGLTWKPIEKYVYRYIWGREAHYSFGIGGDSIFITKQENESIKQPRYMKHFTKHSKISVYYSDNYFKSKRKIVEEGFNMMVSRCCLFVQKPTDMGTKLIVSEVWNRRFFFHDVSILDDFDYMNFRIINDMQSFYTYMYATREVGENGLITSDLLKSDYSNHNFTVVEKNIVVNAANEVASITEIEAFHGISIINTYDEQFLDYVDRAAEGLSKVKTAERANKFIRTKISFNNGANFQFIKPPAIDSNDKPYPECMDCYLHLHTQESSSFPQVYSTKQAPGIIIGVGNVGRHLSFDAKELATFVSSDGGITWKECIKGVHIYEIGDQGGLIVMTPYNTPNRLVIFSHDYGKTFKYVEYTKVSNIIMEPTNNAHQFFIVASTNLSGKDSEDGILVHLDFKEYHQRRCKGHQHPEEPDSDYEKIVPHSYKNSQCLLGRNGFYIRKKPEMKCINPDHFEYFHISHLCKCTEQDWECDVGFTKAGEDESTTCVPLPDYEEPGPPENCRMYYYVSSGYRKVADNVCQGGVKHDKLRRSCPGGLGLLGLIFIYLLRIILYGGGILILYVTGTFVYEKYSDGGIPMGYDGIGSFTDKAKGYFSKSDGQGYEGLGKDNPRVPGLMDDDHYDDEEADKHEEEDDDDDI